MAHTSLTTSRPRTVARPDCGSNSVTRIRRSVVLPAPSGPIRPNSSPRLTSNETPSSAFAPPNCLATLSTNTEDDIDWHPNLQASVSVGDANLDGVDEVGALFPRLDWRWRELGATRDPAHRAAEGLALGTDIEGDLHWLSQVHRGQLRLRDVGAHVQGIEIRDAIERLARLDDFALARVGREHGASARVLDRCLFESIGGACDLRIGGLDLARRGLALRPSQGYLRLVRGHLARLRLDLFVLGLDLLLEHAHVAIGLVAVLGRC